MEPCGADEWLEIEDTQSDSEIPPAKKTVSAKRRTKMKCDDGRCMSRGTEIKHELRGFSTDMGLYIDSDADEGINSIDENKTPDSPLVISSDSESETAVRKYYILNRNVMVAGVCLVALRLRWN